VNGFQLPRETAATGKADWQNLLVGKRSEENRTAFSAPEPQLWEGWRNRVLAMATKSGICA